MLEFLQWMLLVASDCLCFVLQAYIICLIFNKKVKFLDLFIFAIINALVQDLPKVLGFQFSQATILISYVIVMFVTFSLILKFKILHAFFSISFLLIISSVIGFIDMTVLKMIYQDNLALGEWSNTLAGSIVMKNMGNVTSFIAVIAILYFKMKIDMPRDINRKKYMSIFLSSIITAIIIIPNVLSAQAFSDRMPAGMFTYNAILCMLLLAVNIYSTIKSSALEILKQDMQMQNLYVKSLNDVVDKLRGFKHDYNNTVQVIGGYLALNDLEGLRKYHSQMLGECRFVSNTFPLNSYLKENPAIYGLLLSKISYSEVNDIQFVMNISCNLDISSIRIYDFCKVLGILLDNALEAAKGSEKRYVELTAIAADNSRKMSIYISNTFNGDVDIKKIFENGYTTKEGHSGFGLWEVKKIISKYNNFSLSTLTNDSMLTQLLEIQLKDTDIKMAGLNMGLPI